MVIRLTYNLFIRCYGEIIRLVSVFNPKAKLWIQGRNHLFENLDANQFVNEDWVWIHCASLGEFEQGRPVIESLKKSNHKILLTFFSPSGYEKRKNYKGVDAVSYMPLDTKSNAEKFIRIIKPKVVVFVRYEFWINHINELYKNDIPILLISASFRTSQLFFKPLIGNWFRQILDKYSKIYTIDLESKLLLDSYDIKNVMNLGDTRADRVIEIAKKGSSFDKIEQFKNKNQLIICGSVWLADVKILIDSIKQSTELNTKWVLAPHEIDGKNLRNIENELSNAKLIPSRYTDGLNEKSNVLIINNIGILSSIYKYADLVYVGGGFNKGIHNVLEPAIFGTIVLFGPNYKKFPEAIGLIQSGAAFSVHHSNRVNELVNYFLSHKEERELLGEKGLEYINGISGATDAIVKEIINCL